MKVLMIVSGFPSKTNPSRSSFNIKAAQLLNTKHEVLILQLRAWKLNRKLIDFGEFYGFKIIYISFPLFNFQFLKSTFLNHFFLRMVLYFKIKKIPHIDIIHSVGGGLTSYTSHIISKAFNTPFITQYIGSDVNFYLNERNNNRIIKKYINSSSYHVFNSENLKNKFSYLFPLIHDNKRVVYRGVNSKIFYQDRMKPRNPIFLFLGGLTSGDNGKFKDNLKGGVTLLKAWIKLDKKIDLSTSKLIFGGPNSLKIEDYLDIDKLKYKNSFILIGEVSKGEVIDYMNKCNIVIIPSLFEGTPNVAFEAMATGNMIIGTNVGGIPEVVDSNCGFLVEPNNENELVEKMKFIITNPTLINNYSNESKKKIKNFDNHIFLKEYSEIYQQVKKNY